MCHIQNSFQDRAITLYRNVKMRSDEQQAMSSHEMQSALMLMAEFSEKYCRVSAR
jgi:hypothetical protein